MADAFALANAFVRIRPDTAGFRPEADAKLKAALAGLDPTVKIKANTDAAKLVAGDLKAYLDSLVKRNYDLRLSVDDKNVKAKLAADYAMLLKLNKRIEAGVSLAGAAKMQADLLRMDASLDRLKVNLDKASAAARAAFITMETETSDLNAKLAQTDDAAKAVFFTMAGGGAIFGTLGGRISLFGAQTKQTIFNSITGWHLMADVIIEAAAVLIPATIAVIAFGAAGAPAVEAITKQMQNMKIVTEATGKALGPFTGGFQKVAEAVRPQVYQMFGDALTIINKHMGEFRTLALGTGKVLDQLAARASVAFLSGGFNVFLRHAIGDVKQLGDIVGNIFGTIGNFLKVMPGYAQVLLTILDNTTKVIERVTGAGVVQSFAHLGLIGHGAFVYLGLGATIAAKAVTFSLDRISKVALASAIGLGRLGSVGKVAAAGMERFAFAASGAATLPWGWIALAAVATGILAYKIITLKDATQTWLGSMQDALKAQNAVIGFTALQEDQVFVIARLVRAQTALNKVQGASPQVNAGRAGTQGITAQNVAMNQQVVISRDLQAGLHQLTGESILYNQRMATLVATFGSAGEASGLLIASGITMNQMLDTNQNHWLQVLQQVGATQVAYQTMGQTMGMLGADMNALNIMASDQVTQMTKVNQALDGVLQIVQGGQSTFLLFEQALQGIGTAAGATGASMKGIGPNSVALRLAWQTAYTAGFKLLDALRMMTAISPGASKGSFPQLTRAMKDSLAQLLPMGRQSTATRAQMVSLANSINPAITNFKQLTTWIGNIKHPGKDLNDLLASMGLNMQDLAKDAASLSTTMQTQMNAVFSSAKLAASGVDGAVKKLGTDMGATHPNFKQIQGDAQVLYDKLVRNHVMSRQVARDFVTALDPAFHDTGRAAGNSGAAHQVGIFAGSMSNAQKIADTFVHRSPYHVQVIETGKGTFSVSQGGIFAKTSPGSPALAHPAAPGAAGGMFVPGSGQGDTVPAWLTPGEVVVPKGMVRAGAVDHLRGRVPGFAAGGMVGNLGVMNGQATTMFHHQFVNRFTKAMESAMTSAMRSAISAAMSTAAAGSPGGGVQRWRGLVLRALGMEGLSLGLVNDVLYQMQTESGGNPNAINLTDVNARNGDPSRGLMQTIATTFSAYHWPGTSWDIFDPFANIAAAINYGAHNGRGFGSGPGQIGSGHGYGLGGMVMDNGGWIGPGATMVRNNTGRAEHLVPTTGRSGGDVHIHGDLNVREQADAYLIARSLAFQLDA